MPGQKKDTPGELDGGRIFYESLRKQNPKSKMAEEYLLKHGLLPYDEAAGIMAVQQKNKQKSSAKGGKKKNNVKKIKSKQERSKTVKSKKSKKKVSKKKTAKRKAVNKMH